MLLLSSNLVKGQNVDFTIGGNVTGYYFEFEKKLLQKKSETELKGLLEGVFVEVIHDGVVIDKTFTNEYGEYTFTIPGNAVYQLAFSREGYRNEFLKLDTRINTEEDLHIEFLGIEILMNSYKSEERNKESLGKLEFSKAKGRFVFTPDKNRIMKEGLLGKKETFDNAVELLSRAVIKNEVLISSRAKVPREEPEDANNAVESNPKLSADSENANTIPKDSNKIDSNIDISEADVGFEELDTSIKRTYSKADIDALEIAIKKAEARIYREKTYARSPMDEVLIQLKQQKIAIAKAELEKAKALLDTKDREITDKSNQLLLTVFLIIGLIFLLGVTLWFYREKQAVNKALTKQRKITEDSLHYAHRIQRSQLVPAKQIESEWNIFIYYAPKSIVSGDFYWYHHDNKELYLAAIDCTGHGVPGAFLTSIANAELNSIVKEHNITDTGEILSRLHHQIFTGLRQGEDETMGMEGMDMCLVKINLDTLEMQYSGGFNAPLVYDGSEAHILKVDSQSVGGRSLRNESDPNRSFQSNSYNLSDKDRVYLYSDGYMDQFRYQDTQKFGVKRFKNIVRDTYSESLLSQKQTFKKAFKQWKGDQEQIDDVLLLGIAIKDLKQS